VNPAILQCLQADPHVPERRSVADWWPRWRDTAALAPTPAEQAVHGGFDADRVGWAFAAGYQAALRRLLPDLPPQALAAFCVTEDAGNRPRDIHTQFRPAGGGWTIRGAKRWTTLGPGAHWLLVVGAMPQAEEGVRPQLRVARVPADAAGLTLLPMPETRFVPEVPHARVQLDGVHVEADALLGGDGYDANVKPFRSIEDTLVTLAMLAYLLREARARAWPATFAQGLVAAMVLLCDLAAEPADAPATHVALAGALQLAHTLYAEGGSRWSSTHDDPAAARWVRDAPLFDVASGTRARRADRAWERLRAMT